MSHLIKCFTLFLIICVLEFNPTSGLKRLKKNEGIMRISLYRQKSALEQYLNAPDLKPYGLNFDWMKKKPSPPRTNDTISLYRYLDNEFYGKIVVGHPGQTMNVNFDTAWTLTWILSSKCQTFHNIGCLFHNRYNHDQSSEYKKNGTVYVGDEGSYNLTGFYSYDNISFAHSNVTGFSFVEMTSVPSSFLFNKADGVLGLGLPDDSGAYEPFFYALIRQKKIKNPMFSIYLNRDPSSTKGKGGDIMLGFIDWKHVHQTSYPNGTRVYDKITYLPLDAGIQYYRFPVDTLIVTSDKNENFTLCPHGCKAIVDTSTNRIIGPVDDIKKIHEWTNAQQWYFGRWVVPCDSVNKLPKIDFVLGGQYFRLNGKQYITKMSYLSFTVCISAFVPAHNPGLEDLWILGGSFLTTYYSIYNIQDKTIGFVLAA